MDATDYSTKMTEVIAASDLTDEQRKLLEQNWLSFIHYLESRIAKNYLWYRVLTTTSIIGGILIPALNSIELSDYAYLTKVLVSVVAVLSASAVGLNQAFKYNDKWRHFRFIVELARIEGETFLGRGGIYKNKTPKNAFPIFARRLSQIKRIEIETYVEMLDTKDKSQKLA